MRAAHEAGNRIRPPLIFSHFALAAGGLVLWIIYVVAGTDTLAWIAFAALLVVAALGFTMLAIWRPPCARRARPTRPNCLPSSTSRSRSSARTDCWQRPRSFSSSSPRPASAGADREAVVPDPRLARPPAASPAHRLTIGAYTFATIAALLDVTNVVRTRAAHAWWIALLRRSRSTALTATTGFADWITIEWGSPVWKTATTHLERRCSLRRAFSSPPSWSAITARRPATSLPGAFVLTLVGFGLLTAGGWLGGKLVFVHGLRVEKADAA